MAGQPHEDSITMTPPDEEGFATTHGVQLPWRAWGRRGLPGVVLVHGGTAQQHWWDHIAPALAEGRRIVTFDLAGHGDSPHLPSYGYHLWGDETLAVAEAAGIGEHPVLIGHSMGGVVCLDAALRRGDELGGLIIVESVIHWVSDEEMQRRVQRANGRHRFYPTLEEGLERFHTIPASDLALPELMGNLGRTSLKQTPEGWTWKFDLKIFGQDPLTPDMLRPLSCRAAVARGEHGTMTEEIGELVRERLDLATPVHVIDGAGHHVMLEQPAALVAYLDRVLREWDVPLRA